MNTGELCKTYVSIQKIIDERLGEFKSLYKSGGDAALFCEMCFCVCTPQNNAHKAWEAVRKTNLLFNGTQEQLASAFKTGGVRFHNNKASYIVKNRELFLPGIKKKINALLEHGQISARNALAKQVFGWGLKESSHFLRNIGYGDVCILDRHILRKLVEFKVIPNVPKTLPSALYLEIESKMKKFAARIDIPVDALDLLFWHEAKNEVFK